MQFISSCVATLVAAGVSGQDTTAPEPSAPPPPVIPASPAAPVLPDPTAPQWQPQSLFSPSSVLTPTPLPPPETTLGLFGPGQAAFAAPAQEVGFEQGLPAGFLSQGQGVRLGRFQMHGGLSGSVAYNDNVRGRSTDEQEDVVWTLSPFGSIGTEGPNSRAVLASYRPSFLFFMEETDLNAVNHFGAFELRWPFNRLTLGLSENVSVASLVVRDVGDRTMQRTFATQGTASYELSHRTFLQGILRYDVFDYDRPLISSRQWTEQLWLDYVFTSKLKAGLGVSLSQLSVERGSSQNSQGPSLRVSFVPTPRLNLTASAGLEFRQYDSDVSSTMEPVFAVGGVYQVLRGTTISLEAHRAERASGLITGANYLDSGFSVNVSQALPAQWVLTAGGGFSNAEYHSTEADIQTDRSDSYYFLRTALGWASRAQWGAGLFYERRANSSDSGFDYSQNIVGLQASWAF